MQKFTPFMWFATQAHEAAQFYVSVFPDSAIVSVARYPADSPGVEGAVMAVDFTLNGQPFCALNGNNESKPTPALNFMVPCETQAEVDNLWHKLTEEGETMACGWLTDKYGVTWQITPTILPKLMQDANKDKAYRVMQAMMGMVKLNIADLQKAYDGV